MTVGDTLVPTPRGSSSPTSVLPAVARAVSLAARHTASTPGLLLFRAFFQLVVTAAIGGLWAVAADGAGGRIAGYTAAGFVWYVAATETAVTSLPQRLIEMLGDDIATERVAIEMLRPVPVIWMRLATELGSALPRLVVCAATGGAISLVAGGAPPSWVALLLVPPALVLAVMVNLAIQHTFAAAAFWVSDAGAAWFLYTKLVFVLGGMLIPLEVLPDGMAAVCRWLPFMAMAYVPGRLAAGHAEPWLLAVQCGWLVVTLALAWLAFDRGQRRMIGADRP